MKPFHREIRALPPWLLIAAAALAVTACWRPHGPRPTPPPSFTSFAATSRADIVAYGRSLQYDTLQPAQDAQYLLVPHAHVLVRGAYAVLSPEIGAVTIHDPFTPGHILARLVLDEPLPEAKLPRGVSYLWVDSSGAARRAMLVPENDSFPVVVAESVTTRPLCLPGVTCCLRAFARFEVEHVHTDVTSLTPCHPCDGRICCDYFSVQGTP